MNKRINELAKKAAEKTCSLDFERTWDERTWHRVYNEQFAELIVEECIQLALDEKQRYANISHRDMIECVVAMDNYQMLVKEHFGVEE